MSRALVPGCMISPSCTVVGTDPQYLNWTILALQSQCINIVLKQIEHRVSVGNALAVSMVPRV